MRAFKTLFILIGLFALVMAILPARADEPRDLGREVLPENDGWAATAPGTTGGAAAEADNVFVVTDRQELIAALNDGLYPPPSSSPSNTPKIIYVQGMIDVNVDDDNNPLACEDYYRDGYTLEAYLAAYDPEVWGRDEEPSGPLEDARVASRNAQRDRIRIRVGSNTTLVGLGQHSGLKGAWLDIRGQANVPGSRTNIIIRNLNFLDTYDCFPQWDPTDGSTGAWNAEYDSISTRDADHIWIDHNTFDDPETADNTLPRYFGEIFQVHDGQVDITNASDLVTVSWNRFLNHDKVMLIGSSDSRTADRGTLRVTLHHNLFAGTGQRTARVRYGQVHIYNNLYKIGGPINYSYSWGVGIESAIYAENNYFNVGNGVTPDEFMARFNGTAVHETGTWVKLPHQSPQPVDVLAAYNAANDPDLGADVGWVPTLFNEIQPTTTVPHAVQTGSGPFDW